MTALLGRGGFGDVRRIQDSNGVNLARKTLALTAFDNENTDRIRRFKREVIYQSKFNHPNVVPILHSNLESIPPYFDMPLADCCLGEEQKIGIKLNFSMRLRIYLDVLSGIRHIHDMGHTHRDIKPANILRYQNEFVGVYYAVSDFGLVAPSSRDATTNLTSTNVGMGSYNYMAPECYLDSKTATFSSDIYSLGVLLLWLFGDFSEFGFPCEERNSKSVWGDIIQKCTKKIRDERYQSIGELEFDIHAVMAKLGKGTW